MHVIYIDTVTYSSLDTTTLYIYHVYRASYRLQPHTAHACTFAQLQVSTLPEKAEIKPLTAREPC